MLKRNTINVAADFSYEEIKLSIRTQSILILVRSYV